MSEPRTTAPGASALVLSPTFLRFMATGGIAAIVNFGSRFGFSTFTSFPVAVALAYLCGMTTAFVLAKVFVFGETSNTTAQSAFWFVVVNAFALAQTWVVSVTLSEWFFPKIDFTLAPEAVAHAIGVVVPVFSSYFGHKHFSFRAAS